MEWFWWLIIALYFVGMFWYAYRRSSDGDDDFFTVVAEGVLAAFWPLTLVLDWLFDVKY